MNEAIGGPVRGGAVELVILWTVPALTLLATIFHFRRAAGGRGEASAVRRYFLAFFLLLFAAPVLIALAVPPGPAATLEAIGARPGNVPRGLFLAAAGLPLAILSGLLGSRDPAMRRTYPFSKGALADLRTFLGYEASYLALYYVPWELTFRGVLFFPLAATAGVVPALAVQTVASTLYHIGHPETEIFAAAGAGLVFGAVAWATGSFWPCVVLHAATGISTDAFLFLRARRLAVS